jgi:hypothetical protein
MEPTYTPLSVRQISLIGAMSDLCAVPPTIDVALEIVGPVSLHHLKDAIWSVTTRHESLRSGFQSDGDETWRVVFDIPLVSLDVASLQGMSAEEAVRTEAVTGRLRSALDFTTGPVMRVGLCALSADRLLFSMSTHHIVLDAWSVSIILREISHSYRARRTGNCGTLPPAPTLADHVSREQRLLAVGLWERNASYWETKLDGAEPTLRWPCVAREDRPLTKRRRATFNIGTGVSALLRARGQPLFTVMLANFLSQVSAVTGQADPIIGFEVANRDDAGDCDLVGPLSTLALLRLSPSSFGFDATVTDVQAAVWQAADHSALPPEALLDARQKAFSGDKCFARATFGVEHDFALDLTLVDARSRRVDVDDSAGTLDLLTFTRLADDELSLTLDYDTARLDHPAVQRLASGFERQTWLMLRESARSQS